MRRFMKRGHKQNRLRHIWKSVKQMFEICDDIEEFKINCECLYYSDASSELEEAEFKKLVICVCNCY